MLNTGVETTRSCAKGTRTGVIKYKIPSSIELFGPNEASQLSPVLPANAIEGHQNYALDKRLSKNNRNV